MSRLMNVLRGMWLAVASVAVLVAVGTAAIVFVPANRHRSDKLRADALLFKKGDPDAIKVGKSREAAIGPNEVRNPNATPDVEAYLRRAYPAGDIPTDASWAAQQGWKDLDGKEHSRGTWQLIGPTKASEPGVLDVLGDGARVVESGRVSAMAIGPSCTEHHCPIYVAPAGGGVWRTRNGLDDDPDWEFLSTSFGTNAMGGLLIDPKDSSGPTIYAATGEPNASADSEAGVGIYKSTDGGESWSLVPGSDLFFQRSIGQMAFDNAGNLLVPVASGVRGIDETDGGALSSGSTTHPLVARGLYRQSGSTFAIIFTAPGVTRGSTTVKVDPTHPGFIYVNAFGQGIWRSTDNGATFAQIFTAQDPTVAGSAIDRSEFDITTLPSGATRMYVGEGQGGGAGHTANFWRSDNADTAATFASMGGAQVDNYCTTQCWYDNVVFTPAGHPNIVYLLGCFDYGQVNGPSNARGVLLSTDGGTTWSDLTQDAHTPRAHGIHPDQHAIVVHPNNPYLFWEGSDGGVVRSDGQFRDITYKCATRGLSASDQAFCISLLWRVPRELKHLNKGLSTLQFQSLSVSNQHDGKIQGGTQDNGTFQSRNSVEFWPQEIYGDGGQSGFNASNDALRFNTFTGQANDVNFQDGDPTKWVIATGVIVSSPESSYFYPPVTADPNPARGGTIFQGSFSIWRTQDWAGSQAFLEANCPEFTTSAANTACGDFVTIGPPGQTDLTDSGAYPGQPFYGSDRRGGAVGVITRSTNRHDTGTLWAATGTGRVFISSNANDPASSVVWTRIDNKSGGASIGRFPTGIYIDPANPNHGWISYSGYNVTTPTQPGHVFEVAWNGTTATWTDLSSNLPDFPITSLVYDHVTGDLYAASDFGVMRLAKGSSTWKVAGKGLPMVEVPHLTIVSHEHQLYAATHGRSAWALQLPDGDDDHKK